MAGVQISTGYWASCMSCIVYMATGTLLNTGHAAIYQHVSPSSHATKLFAKSGVKELIRHRVHESTNEIDAQTTLISANPCRYAHSIVYDVTV